MRGASRLDAFSVYPFRTWLLCHAVGRQQIHQWSVHPGPLVLRTAPLKYPPPAQGGKLIVGVDDKNHQVIGVENDILFQTMDAIATAVSDSCMPQIIPDIEPQTVEGKTIIIVSVEAGKNRPYYLKSKGKENGTYIRVAGTSRQAFPEKIKELEMEGARISWDELTCVGYTVTEEATEKLCQDIEVFRKKAGMSEYSVKKE